ncbi:MAG: hypothetical protein Q9227_003578 [Pyrenula ochraceoflavens]
MSINPKSSHASNSQLLGESGIDSKSDVPSEVKAETKIEKDTDGSAEPLATPSICNLSFLNATQGVGDRGYWSSSYQGQEVVGKDVAIADVRFNAYPLFTFPMLVKILTRDPTALPPPHVVLDASTALYVLLTEADPISRLMNYKANFDLHGDFRSDIYLPGDAPLIYDLHSFRYFKIFVRGGGPLRVAQNYNLPKEFYTDASPSDNERSHKSAEAKNEETCLTYGIEEVTFPGPDVGTSRLVLSVCHGLAKPSILQQAWSIFRSTIKVKKISQLADNRIGPTLKYKEESSEPVEEPMSLQSSKRIKTDRPLKTEQRTSLDQATSPTASTPLKMPGQAPFPNSAMGDSSTGSSLPFDDSSSLNIKRLGGQSLQNPAKRTEQPQSSQPTQPQSNIDMGLPFESQPSLSPSVPKGSTHTTMPSLPPVSSGLQQDMKPRPLRKEDIEFWQTLETEQLEAVRKDTERKLLHHNELRNLRGRIGDAQNDITGLLSADIPNLLSNVTTIQQNLVQTQSRLQEISESLHKEERDLRTRDSFLTAGRSIKSRANVLGFMGYEDLRALLRNQWVAVSKENSLEWEITPEPEEEDEPIQPVQGSEGQSSQGEGMSKSAGS